MPARASAPGLPGPPRQPRPPALAHDCRLPDGHALSLSVSPGTLEGRAWWSPSGRVGSVPFLNHLGTGEAWLALVVENLPANAGDVRDVGSIAGSERPPGGGNGNPLQRSCLENPKDRGTWWATVHGVAKSWTRPRHGHSILLKGCGLGGHGKVLLHMDGVLLVHFHRAGLFAVPSHLPCALYPHSRKTLSNSQGVL